MRRKMVFNFGVEIHLPAETQTKQRETNEQEKAA